MGQKPRAVLVTVPLESCKSTIVFEVHWKPHLECNVGTVAERVLEGKEREGTSGRLEQKPRAVL